MSKAILLLAAGNSSRLGQPKQLLKWKEQSLLEHTLTKALCITQDIYVVTGGYQSQISPLLKKLKINELYFSEWKEGMGSSISFGLSQILIEKPELQKIMIILSDMPLVSEEHLLQLWEASKQHAIVISKYEKIKGVPAVFDQSFFSELQKLKGDQGAKQFLQKYKNKIQIIESEIPYLDIDTEKDYLTLLEKEQTQVI